MTAADPIRIVTIDDHEFMRGGIRFLLMAFDDLELVGEARRGEDAVALCKTTRPDVALVDVKMSGIDGVETTKRIKSEFPDTAVVILTSFHDHGLVHRSLRAGAIGYVTKDASKEELAEAIRAAHEGKLTISPAAAQDLTDESEPEVELTERELEVLRLLVQGMSNKEMAKQLHRSPFTIRHHVSELIKKLNAGNRAEVAAIATSRGLVS